MAQSRLSAILAADGAGCSRFVGEYEHHIRVRLKACESEVIELMEQYRAARPQTYDQRHLPESHLRLCMLGEERQHWLEGYILTGWTCSPGTCSHAMNAKVDLSEILEDSQ